MTSSVAGMVRRGERSDSISLAYRDRRNGKDVAKLRSSRHGFPESILRAAQDERLRIEGVYSVLRDTLHDEHLMVTTPEGFEPVPVLVVGER